MSGAILLTVGLALLSLLANLLLASTSKGRAKQEVSSEPVDHVVTIWRERPAYEPAADSSGLAPQKITVEYMAAIQADSKEKLASSQADIVAAASEDFQRQFTPLLGDQQTNSGAVRIGTSGEDE